MVSGPKLEAQLSIRPGAGAPFRKRWMDLLGSLESERSITAAAKAVGLPSGDPVAVFAEIRRRKDNF